MSTESVDYVTIFNITLPAIVLNGGPLFAVSHR